MSRSSITLFPSLNERHKEYLGIVLHDYELSYESSGEFRALRLSDENTGKEGIFSIEDDCGIWNPEECHLKIRKRIDLHYAGHLFGKGGIVYEDTKLGIAFHYYSKESNQRGTKSIGTFNAKDFETNEAKEFDFRLKINEGYLRGIVCFELLLYIKEPGTPGDYGSYFANETGVIIGVLESMRLILDGDGSLFPIKETEMPGEPLWKLHCNWSNPMEDPFSSENVCVYLNTSHSDYKILNTEAGLKKNPLMLEIISSALQTIVLKVKRDETSWNCMEKDIDVEAGSIVDVIRYFVFELGWDYTSEEALSYSIRKYLEMQNEV
jgi:hypothetical protein